MLTEALLSPKLIAVVLSIVAIVGLFLYLRRESRKDAAKKAKLRQQVDSAKTTQRAREKQDETFNQYRRRMLLRARQRLRERDRRGGK